MERYKNLKTLRFISSLPFKHKYNYVINRSVYTNYTPKLKSQNLKSQMEGNPPACLSLPSGVVLVYTDLYPYPCLAMAQQVSATPMSHIDN